MWIPTHYVVLFIAILLAESTVLFVYTIIGLVKQNPMPFLFPPQAPEFPLCQYAPVLQSPTTNQGLTSVGDSKPLQPILDATRTAVVTSTSILQQMLSMAPDGQILTVNINDISTAHAAALATMTTSRPSPSSDVPSSASSTSARTTSSTIHTSSSSTSTESQQSSSVSSSTTSSSQVTSSSSSSDSPQISTFTGKGGVLTSVVMSTTTLPPKSIPVPTITSVVVMPAAGGTVHVPDAPSATPK
ncbi:MAG: hypothetical protein M1828_005684 [Chrysothrix sp. TS-e1954]|nr:MAG: hypothetical protein M1828_005684 [Chrysothrix sp. TS-e1954]